ncbi:dephospho-CoA kinase [Estrella lausannensis]|uniref:Dephospho-CoA kinase n=1 Tax=Estrella lausannensis TaxID=483423 RepID=A0A0H5DQQ0_9BACT|nr:dephospho-CoA kinase [Estrella lausannensis]CRX38986.1 Dephospho-CoA kinase [Estrella lausannensis]
MLKLKKIAITGGISCGKSEFCRYLEEFGAYYVSADSIVHQILSPNTSLGRQVIDLLGAEVIDGGRIDRKKVAEKVFSTEGLLEKLEKITHPEVFKEIEHQYEKASAEGKTSLFAAEIPLLFEAGGEKAFDATIAVVAPLEKCLERYSQLPGKANDFAERMRRQLPPEEKAERADIVIENSGTKDELKEKAREVYNFLTQQ